MTQTSWVARPTWPQLNGTGPGTVARPRAPRRGRLVVGAVGLVVMALAVVVFETLVPRAPHSRDVLVASRSIPAGEVITANDLKAITVASSQLAGVPASSRDEVVGRTAGLDIGGGQPLVPSDIGGSPGPGPGEAVVGVSLADGRFPAALVAGDTVVVVDTPGSTGAAPVGATAATPDVELASGQVLSVAGSSDGTSTDVALVVPMAASDAVAAASATDSVSLVWVAQ